jgi:hypothetical protein
MKIKVGDLITLTEEGKTFYSSSNLQIFKITKIYSNTLNIHAQSLVDHNNYNNFMTRKNYRKATEIEVKLYKIKNLFNKRGI